MIIAITLALAAAACWAIGGLVSVFPAHHLGAASFTRYNLLFVSGMLLVATLILGGWETLGTAHLWPLAISGLVGIFLGDTAFFATLRRMGPRRSSILFAMNAPITTILGLAFLNESLSLSIAAGCFAVLAGVILAIIFGKSKNQQHHWEAIKGNIWIGIGLGLIAATCQAAGVILSKPAMDAGVDPIVASFLRVAVSGVVLTLMCLTPDKRFRSENPMNLKVAGYVLLAGVLGVGFAMTFVMIALKYGDSGVVATLAATSPVLMLPIIWVKTKEFPSLAAWGGALSVVIGTGLILNG